MTEDYAARLEAEWEKHRDWHKVGELVSELRAQSFRAGYAEGSKKQGIKALDALLATLR